MACLIVTRREFTLVNMETNEERHIHQMQYIAWPDHGVPEDSSDFLDFVIRVRQVSAIVHMVVQLPRVSHLPILEKHQWCSN